MRLFYVNYFKPTWTKTVKSEAFFKQKKEQQKLSFLLKSKLAYK